MRRSLMDVTFVCPNCRKAVDPTKPNAMMSAATKQWQHKDCWNAASQSADSTSSNAAQPLRGERG
jgi:hypothetical protein